MGLDKEGICILRPHTTCLTECVEGKVSSRCDCEKWTSVGKFVDVLGVVELVCILNTTNSYVGTTEIAE